MVKNKIITLKMITTNNNNNNNKSMKFKVVIYKLHKLKSGKIIQCYNNLHLKSYLINNIQYNLI